MLEVLLIPVTLVAVALTLVPLVRARAKSLVKGTLPNLLFLFFYLFPPVYFEHDN